MAYYFRSSMVKIFIIVSSYENEEDFGCNPFGYYVEFNGERLAEYGDDYHEKGQYKSEAFVEGYCLGKEIKPDEYEIECEERADFND
jgi:hypothetical protein